MVVTVFPAPGLSHHRDQSKLVRADAKAIVWEKTPPNPPHKGEGLTLPIRRGVVGAGLAPQVFSPLVGEMAGRPERVFLKVQSPPGRVKTMPLFIP
jgi:cobaltochelatase CobN